MLNYKKTSFHGTKQKKHLSEKKESSLNFMANLIYFFNR